MQGMHNACTRSSWSRRHMMGTVGPRRCDDIDASESTICPQKQQQTDRPSHIKRATERACGTRCTSRLRAAKALRHISASRWAACAKPICGRGCRALLRVRRPPKRAATSLACPPRTPRVTLRFVCASRAQWYRPRALSLHPIAKWVKHGERPKLANLWPRRAPQVS
jgi:hypothetical protein